MTLCKKCNKVELKDFEKASNNTCTYCKLEDIADRKKAIEKEKRLIGV